MLLTAWNASSPEINNATNDTAIVDGDGKRIGSMPPSRTIASQVANTKIGPLMRIIQR